METRLASLTNSVLVPIPNDDLKMAWIINKATGTLDSLARTLSLGDHEKTWVGGSCYYDYENFFNPKWTFTVDNPENRRLQLSVNRKYQWRQ